MNFHFEIPRADYICMIEFHARSINYAKSDITCLSFIHSRARLFETNDVVS